MPSNAAAALIEYSSLTPSKYASKSNTELIFCASSEVFSIVNLTPTKTLPSPGVKKLFPSDSLIYDAVTFIASKTAVSLSPKVSSLGFDDEALLTLPVSFLGVSSSKRSQPLGQA